MAIIDVIIGYAVNQFKVWWRKVISKKFPNAADILEALLEYTIEVCQFTAKVVKFLSPYIVWLIQTFIAIVLFIGGSFICGIIILAKGRDAAENSHAGEVQSSAMKSLNLSIQNSPFYSRKAVPFTPRFVSNNDERVDAPIVVNQTAAAANTSGSSNGGGRRVQSTASFKSPPGGGQMAPISVMRRNSSLKSNQNTPTVVATKPTPNTRRVLFSESEHGEVDTEQFFYDKTLPASVRKVGRVDNENKQQQQQMMIMADETQNDTPNKTTSPTMASTTAVVENKILRPSSFGPGGSSTDNRSQHKNTSQVAAAAAAVTNQPSTAVKKQQAEQEEQSKQQYIEKYGLLPTITPLSKRYGRMKRQQQQSLSIALSTIPANKTTGTNNVNAKRKRREIVGVASRMGRRRLNNFRANSALPVVMLGKNTPTKRRREDEQNRADEWVWRAMNSDGEKENLYSQGDGTATKRAKVANDGSGPPEVLPPGLSTPPKSINKSFSSVTTPPKTPGPSTFSLGSSTPAPKGNKDSSIGATPAKPSMPSFTFNETPSSSGGGFSFGTSDAATDAKSKIKDDSVKTQDNVPTFSFGSTRASKPAEKNETIAPSFSFGAGGDAANSDDAKASASAKPDEQKGAVPSFSFGAAGTTASKDGKETEQRQSFAFGASSTPAPTTAQDSSTKAPFSFGSKTNTPAASDTPSEITQAPSFAFGSTSTPAQDSTPKPSFSFGSTGQANVTSTSQAPAATPAPAATGFAFGAANQTPAAATGAGVPSSGFSFGTANQTPAASTTAATTGDMKQAPSFSFGGTAAPAPNQTPTTAPSVPASSFSFGSTTATAPSTGATPASTFAFGGQTPGGAGGGVTNSFTVGGSGASARRRAKAAGRRK